MRSDMAKVIVERPRHRSRMRGRAKGYRRRQQQTPFGELPKREKMNLDPSKSLNEHLGPLRRYLQKQVGRPWDKVFSEICANISRDSAVQDHVRDHVLDYVATRVIDIGGVLHFSTRWGNPVPLSHSWYRVPLFYVCPESGLLKVVKREPIRKLRSPSPPDLIRPIDHDTAFIRHEGRWSWVRFEFLPKTQRSNLCEPVIRKRDALQQMEIDRVEAVRRYGRAVYAAQVRAAASEEIRKYCEPLKAPNRV